MQKIISGMLDKYERGRISRRQLVQAFSALVAASTTARAVASTFQGVEVNHVALNVTDVKRSRDFYQKHLGLPAVRESEQSCFLGLGSNFLALFEGRNPGMNHYCLAIEDYEVAKVTAKLEAEGLNPRRTQNRVYFQDPDGLTVQLSSTDHQP